MKERGVREEGQKEGVCEKEGVRMRVSGRECLRRENVESGVEYLLFCGWVSGR